MHFPDHFYPIELLRCRRGAKCSRLASRRSLNQNFMVWSDTERYRPCSRGCSENKDAMHQALEYLLPLNAKLLFTGGDGYHPQGTLYGGRTDEVLQRSHLTDVDASTTLRTCPCVLSSRDRERYRNLLLQQMGFELKVQMIFLTRIRPPKRSLHSEYCPPVMTQ